MEPEPLRYAEFASPLGHLWIAATAQGLAAVELDGDEAEVLAGWERRFGRSAQRDPHSLRAYAAELEAYFAGARTRFALPIDLLMGTPFQRKVWAALCTIPYGETRSYKWLAAQVDREKGFRAVGLANGANPIPIVIPCHRVVNANGNLGGYGGGLDMKRALLRLEGALPRALPLETRAPVIG